MGDARRESDGHDDSVNFAVWLLEHGSADAIALVQGERSVSFGDLRRRVSRISSYVRGRVDASDTCIVPILGGTSINTIAAYLGVLHAGCVAAPLPPMTRENMVATLAETNAQFALADDSADAGTIEAVRIASVLTTDCSEAAATATLGSRLAAIMYTSGSTGRPRGVMVTVENLRTNTQAILDFLPIATTDRVLSTLPLFYCFGASVVHTHLRAGATTILVEDTSPGEVLRLLRVSGATIVPGVPSLFTMLLRDGGLSPQHAPELRSVMISGGRAGVEMIGQLARAVPHAKIYVRYGVTELTAAAAFLAPEMLQTKLGSIGRGIPRLPLEVLRADGSPVPAGSKEIGEIVGRGPCVARGYYRDPESTSSSFRAGAFYTGDLATVDADGFIFIVAREKSFIKTSGHRVAPEEVEATLAQAPGVHEVAICGVPHALRGEALAALVVLDEETPATMYDLRRHCSSRLDPLKVPVHFQVVTSLPRSPNGKLDRARLRQLVEATRKESK